MLEAAVLIGEPLKFGEICYVYPPKIKEVIGNTAL
jgi:hypothetical protein